MAIITAARDRATEIIRTARPALDALADELTAHEMVDSRRLDEILVKSGFIPQKADASGARAVAAAAPADPAPARAATTRTGPAGPSGP